MSVGPPQAVARALVLACVVPLYLCPALSHRFVPSVSTVVGSAIVPPLVLLLRVELTTLRDCLNTNITLGSDPNVRMLYPRHSLSPVLHTRITYPGSRMCGPAHSMCGLHPAITHAWHHCRASIRHPLVSSKAHRGLRQLHLWILLDVGFVARRPLTLLQRVCLGLTSPFLLGLYATRDCTVVKSHDERAGTLASRVRLSRLLCAFASRKGFWSS